MTGKLDLFKMADKKDQEKDKKKSIRTARMVYYRCLHCGVRKPENGMMNVENNNVRQKCGMCQECFEKQMKKKMDEVDKYGKLKTAK